VCVHLFTLEKAKPTRLYYHTHTEATRGQREQREGQQDMQQKGHGSTVLWPHDLSMAIHAKFIRRHSARGRKPPEALVQARTQSFIYAGDTASVKLKVGKSFHGVLSSLQ
jgi:hypothetical protein